MSRFAKTPKGKRLGRYGRRLVTAAVLAYLVYRVSAIGWDEVWASLPRTPWFYVLFAGIYFTQPLTQAVIYQKIWPTSLRSLIPAALIKRVYDREVLSYSGDVYLYGWARDRLRLSALDVFHSIKDNAIVSSIASTGIAFGLLAYFVASGAVPLPDLAAGEWWAYGGGALCIGVIVAVAVRKLWRSMFKLPLQLLGVLFALHVFRIALAQVLQVTQWSVVEPTIPLEVWFAFLAAQIMTGRIPLLPSKDLLFLAAGIEMAGAVNVAPALIAGLLGTQSVLDKAGNFVAFVGFTLWMRWGGTEPEVTDEELASLPGTLDDSRHAASSTS